MIVAYIKDYMVLENKIINMDKTIEKLRWIVDSFNEYYKSLFQE
jgi:hypothetical protein